MSERVLVIEDDLSLAQLLCAELTDAGLRVDCCADGASGVQKALSEKYALILLDLMLPAMHGIEVCKRIRREQPALQRFRGLRFHETSNDRILCYSKSLDDGSRPVLCVVNLDPVWRQSALLDFSPGQLSPQLAGPYQVEDLLTGRSYRWEQGFNYVELDPRQLPAHIFAVTAA